MIVRKIDNVLYFMVMKKVSARNKVSLCFYWCPWGDSNTRHAV